MTKKINLVLVPDPREHDPHDFVDIAGRIRALCSDVIPHVCLPRHLKIKRWLYALRPTLYVASRPLGRFKPLRGLVLGGLNLAKSEQYRRIESAGFATPKWQILEADTRLSAEEWGRYVVVKPDIGKCGHQVRVKKTGRVRGEDYQDGKGRVLAQQFIYTGPEPIAYRALTLFGKVLYLRYSRNTNCGKPLSGPDGFAEVGGYNIVASPWDGENKLVEDESIMRYAEDIATRCFPDIPILGMDVIREFDTGQLFVAEVNPYGQTWHFSSPSGLGVQREYGIDYAAQFGAFDIAADRLIEVAREQAR